MNVSRYLLCAIAIFVLAATMSSCTRGEVTQASNEMPPVQVEKATDLSLVTVAHPERFPLVTATSRPEVNQLLANGSVVPDISRTVPVNALASGRVLDLRVRLGDDVQRGQLMLTFTSPDMAQAFSDYEKFQADEKLAKRQLDRSKLLLEHGAAAQKDVEVAEDTYNKAVVDTRTAAEHIRILGGDPDHPSAVIDVRAPVSGTIIEQNVTTAAGVKSPDSSPNLFTLADLSHVWVVCDVYENDLARVRLGDIAQIELNAYPNRTFEGRISNISKLLDPTTRSAKVRIQLNNPQGLFRPNMFAVAHFYAPGAELRTVVPAAAVLRLHDRDWVFVSVGGNQFHRVEVHAGAMNSDGTEQILSGLHPGEHVIGDALLFDRESSNQ